MNRCAGIVLIVAAVVGCTSTKTSNTARTAREQLLISNAIDHSLAKIDFTAFRGSKVFLEDKYLESVDKGYLVGSIRHRALMNGAVLASKAEEADIVLELRSGAIGTDQADSFVGTPQIMLPGMLSIPEVRIISRNNQSAIAKIGILAYDAKTREPLGVGGVSSSISHDNNWYVVGIGPYQQGEIKSEVQRTTGRYPGQPYQEVPVAVAFQKHVNADDPNRLQLTGEEQPQ